MEFFNIKFIYEIIIPQVDGEKHGMNLVGSAENGANVGSKTNRIVHDSLRFAQRTSSKPAAVVVQQVHINYLKSICHSTILVF